ncbi:sigma factor RpoE negative regulatory protein RseA [Vibrio maritimus]|uniref:Sigma factor RpoE negative regulatory protein RseA n=1 Tax=Vibrio maritimus TaxID=990268 RepID=A0A090RVU2_9VIBR|nr:sigma factor RpoE negative regulatory protein RseA [Vibrio maritimus]
MADKQKLSAFMDGDLIDDALIEALENDQESKEAWQNYHLIGDVMRGDEPQSLDWNIAESVALALEDELRIKA